ncbi:putative Glycosyltransferase [Mesorhizobium sp. ORS 3324]|nr:putative Glycosyltransferase [Mesorhizobium sp. ORS 3324]
MTKPGTVLLLSTYPIVKPQHGGQVRLLNIKRAYERAGWKVASLAVYTEESYSNEVGSFDIPFPATSKYRLFNGRNVPLITDLLSGPFAAAEDGGLPSILAQIPAQIDVIHVEQPWLWPLAVELKKRPQYASAITVYGSQNIEEPLKRSIFEDYNVGGADEVLRAIEALERNAARDADLTLAVTQDDAAVLEKWGADKVALQPNGIEAWHADDKALAKWREKLPKFPWLLYVASAHPPNFTRFSEILGDSLACFPPTSRLVVVGSVTEHIYRVMNSTRWSHLNLSRLQLLFTLSDEDLAAVKSLAHGFILPIPFGGGSNLKTAEALYSGSYVVGTPAAFRGYEDCMDLPEVRVADNPKSFQRSIREVLFQPSPPPLEPGSQALARRQDLRWEARMDRLPPLVEKLMQRGAP